MRGRAQRVRGAVGPGLRLPRPYLSGGGVAAGSLGYPDLGITGLDDVLVDVCRTVDASGFPLLVYVDADGLFSEAMEDLGTSRKYVDAVNRPIPANITEFGSTPLLLVEELQSAHVAIVLYPLSAFRAMSNGALSVF